MPKHPVPSGELVTTLGPGNAAQGRGWVWGGDLWRLHGISASSFWGRPVSKKAEVGSPKEGLPKEGSFGL